MRDITVTYSEGNALPPDWRTAAGPEGAAGHFRHSFQEIAPGRVRTTIMYQSEVRRIQVSFDRQ